MTMLSVEIACDDEDQPGLAQVARPDDDIKTFVAAIAVVLRETVAGFEQTVSRITDITALRPGGADRDLVVALQDFDRLQQEFATLGDVLARLPGLSGATAEGEQSASDTDHPVLAGISIAGLKERLSRHVRSLALDQAASDDASDEVEF